MLKNTSDLTNPELKFHYQFSIILLNIKAFKIECFKQTWSLKVLRGFENKYTRQATNIFINTYVSFKI